MFKMLLCVPLIILGVHVALSRILRGHAPQAVAFRAIIYGYVPAGLLFWLVVFRQFPVGKGMFVALFFCFAVYSSLAYTYFHFFNMSETARRIRILYEVYRAGSLPLTSIGELYKTADIIGLRLKRLVETNKLRYESGHYILNDKILYCTALFITQWRKLIGFK